MQSFNNEIILKEAVNCKEAYLFPILVPILQLLIRERHFVHAYSIDLCVFERVYSAQWVWFKGKGAGL